MSHDGSRSGSARRLEVRDTQDHAGRDPGERDRVEVRADTLSGPLEAPSPTDSEWTPPAEFDEYRIVRLLGQGSMGRVYLARDTVLDRPVAVKFITHIVPDAEDRERFLVEARAVARVQHPNVVTIHRVGELENHPYLITEYVAGKSLSELATPVGWRKLLELGVGIARGLAAAHRQGVLHRDIKLANAVLSATGDVKLLDFSLAKLLDPALDPSLYEPAPAVRMAPLEGPHDRTMSPGEARGATGSRTSLVWMQGSDDMSAHSATSLTMHGTLLGTPNYMAPELWRNEPATRRSDVYALGVLMYILASGRPPTEAEALVDLAMRVQEDEPQALLERAPRCDPRLAAIIDRCLRRDPFERFTSADELLAALEAVSPTGRELVIPEGNPYRGLEAFESRHRALFFGRGVEVRAVLERLRAGALVVVAGDSGVGKSSLCKAGVVPQVEEGALDPQRVWTSATMTPGRYPLQTLIATLARLFDMTEEAVGAMLATGAEGPIRALRRQLGDARGVLLLIDQLEELATLGAPHEVAVVGPLLARLASGMPGLRVLATVRGDFLTRVAQLPGVGDELSQAIYFLRPLAPEGAREAIVGPARVKDVGFATEALVDELVKAGSQGSLPLLQFALAELWEIRDPATRSISAEDLRKIGGVSGALARHGDAALAELISEQRIAARRVLMRLVTVDDTRAVRTEDELTAGAPAAQAALKALVRSRLVLVREVGDQAVHEIAHEALIGGWATLGAWLEEERESRAVHHRLELAVAEWERLGRGRDALLTGAPLQELRGLDPASLRPKEREFIAACRSAVRRTRVLRRALLVSVPALTVLAAGSVWLKGQVDLRARVDAHAAAASENIEAVEAISSEAEALRSQAYAAFDAGRAPQGEELWARHVETVTTIERGLAQAAQQLEMALSLDNRRADVRGRLLDVLWQRAVIGEQVGRDELSMQDQLDRIRLYDHSGEHMQRWDTPAQLTVTSDPPGARVTLERYIEEDRRLRAEAVNVLGVTPLAPQTLPRGSYRLIFEMPGKAVVRYPVALARGESLDIAVSLASADMVPEGFIYVPPGRFLYGSRDADAIRDLLGAEPMHLVETGPYLIARDEVTYDDYIRYLAAQTPEQRAALADMGPTAPMRLEAKPEGGWRLILTVGAITYKVDDGSRLVYTGRAVRTSVPWQRLPVTGISAADATAYLVWLDRTGQVPGARLCDEHEWERAARGADGRLFASTNELRPTDANFDDTYDKVVSAYGPDPVGSYLQTESPFGLRDTDGNAQELTVSPHPGRAAMVRGGSYFYSAIAARAAVHFQYPPGYRDTGLGLRVCATWPSPTHKK